MAIWRGSSEWDQEMVPTLHGPAYSVHLTDADWRRIDQVLMEARRFRMPTFRDELLGLTMKLDQATRAQTVAWL